MIAAAADAARSAATAGGTAQRWFARLAGARDAPSTGCCAACRHFSNDAARYEAASPGLVTLSSAYGAVLGGDGICSAHLRYVSPASGCSRFTAQMR